MRDVLRQVTRVAKSVRLDAGLERKLRRAARAAGTTESALMRDAIAARCDAILGETLYDRWKDILGKFELGGVARRGDEVLDELLSEDRRRQRVRRARARRSA